MDLPRGAVASLPLPGAVRRRLPGAKPRVAVVRLQGVIAASAGGGLGRRATLDVDGVEPALKRAFELPRVAEVALVINSPGGAPTQSALIGERIRALSAKHEVPVLAVCEDVAASGGYWLACAADEIVAHETSMVGSIGVVAGGFGLHELLGRQGVERRLHTAGTNKARLDPFLPEREEDVAWLRGELDALHAMFVAWVRERRGDRLHEDRGEDLFSGEAWTGARAHELGLVDRLGTLRGVLEERHPDAEVVRVHKRRSIAGRIGLPIGAGVGVGGLAAAVPELLEALEHRAAWARYGR